MQAEIQKVEEDGGQAQLCFNGIRTIILERDWLSNVHIVLYERFKWSVPKSDMGTKWVGDDLTDLNMFIGIECGIREDEPCRFLILKTINSSFYDAVPL